MPLLGSTAASLLSGLLAGLPFSAATRYVWQDSPHPAPPHTHWATAAHSVQDAVDAAAPGDDIVVTNGVDAKGGRPVPSYPLMTNRPPLTSRSPCTASMARNSRSSRDTGGAFGGDIPHSTLAGNSAGDAGGGAHLGALDNTIAYFNQAPRDADCGGCTFEYSCTTPLPLRGLGNITKAPLFVDGAGGNLRLQSNSPCINAGLNACATNSTHLDGNPRLVSGTVNIGAYEYQGPASAISCAWLQHDGLPTDASADATDPDADGHKTWQEWRCGTCPTNALSLLRLLPPSPAGSDVKVTWQSVAGVSCFLERSTNLLAAPRFTLLATGIPGQPVTTTFTDTNAVGLLPRCYRVGVPVP